jgi:hypothetical protein
MTLGESCASFPAKRFAGPAMRNMICCLILIALVLAVQWALRQLARRAGGYG